MTGAVLKLVVTGLWFAALAVGERVFSAAHRPAGSDRSRWWRNLGLGAGVALIAPVVTIPITSAAAGIELWSRPEIGPAWAWLVGELLVLDAWIYLWHRLNHEAPFLWRFHQVHHRDEFLDVTSALRFHPGEVALSALARAPLIIACDISLQAILIFETMTLAAALFHHSNVALPPVVERALRFVIVTPSHHWMHHHAAQADTDSNYGTVLTVWDRLFATFNAKPRTMNMKIGVEGARDESLPRLAALPFVPIQS